MGTSTVELFEPLDYVLSFLPLNCTEEKCQ
jgi:hypothetical protein